MQIRDLETQTGLDRATIRFYEKEGLLHPKRSENGYRDYSEEDAGELRKIMLLRELGLPIDTIRGLQQGSEDFSEVMARQARILENRAENMQRAKAVCQRMRDEEADYRRLEPGQYQTMLTATLLPSEPSREAEPFRETVRREVHPWRRFIARMVDGFLINAVLSYIVVVLLRWRTVTDFLFSFLGYISWLIMIPVDGALIHFTGTTPGKWMMGIRIENPDGRKMGLREAIVREARAFGRGMGWGIPVYELYRLYRSYSQYTELSDGDWNENTELVFPAWNWLRKALIPVSLAAGILLTVISSADAILPQYRGNELTISQFASNYNFYNDILYDGNAKGMYSDGTFPKSGGITTIVLDNGESVIFDPYGDFQYETVNATVTAVTMHHSWYENFFGWYGTEEISADSAGYWLYDHCKVAMVAAAAARPGMDADKLDDFVSELNEWLKRPAGDGVVWEYGGLTYSWQIDAELYCQPESENGVPVYYVTLDLRIDFGK